MKPLSRSEQKEAARRRRQLQSHYKAVRPRDWSIVTIIGIGIVYFAAYLALIVIVIVVIVEALRALGVIG